jgi:membrane protein implicated in regulation of membrane protease activity
MRFVRLWLPLLIILAGLVLAVAVGTDAAWEGGALLISAGLSVWLLNVLFRLGVRGDSERRSEERAREEFDRTGRWPDDETPASRPRDGGTS